MQKIHVCGACGEPNEAHKTKDGHWRGCVSALRALVPCARKPDTHGFHRAGEQCSYCEPEAPATEQEIDLPPPHWMWDSAKKNA